VAREGLGLPHIFGRLDEPPDPERESPLDRRGVLDDFRAGAGGLPGGTIDPMHLNPVRRGLVERPEDWEWSSARWYAGIRPVPLEIDSTLPRTYLIGVPVHLQKPRQA
jgi:hypothetical protein